MALVLTQPANEIDDIGTDDFIRKIRELWTEYADPKYIDLIDTDHVDTDEEVRINPDLGIIIPEIFPFKPGILSDEEQ